MKHRSGRGFGESYEYVPKTLSQDPDGLLIVGVMVVVEVVVGMARGRMMISGITIRTILWRCMIRVIPTVIVMIIMIHRSMIHKGGQYNDGNVGSMHGILK